MNGPVDPDLEQRMSLMFRNLPLLSQVKEESDDEEYTVTYKSRQPEAEENLE